MEKVRNSSLLKIISYILIPILVAIIGLSIFHLGFLNEFSKSEATKYEDTEMFANNYFSFLIDNLEECKRQEIDNEYNMFSKIENADGKRINYYDNLRNYSNYYNHYDNVGQCIEYIIVNKKTNEIFTNMRSNDYEKTKEEISNSKYHWNYINDEVNSSIEFINKDNIVYNTTYRYLDNMIVAGQPGYNNKEELTTCELTGYDIFSRYNEEKLLGNSSYTMIKQMYDFALQHKTMPFIALPVSALLLMIIAIYLLWAIGYNKKGEIELNLIDNIPYEILSIISLTLITIFITIAINIINITNYIMITVFSVLYILCYIIVAVFGITTIKRIKAKKFLESFIIFRICRWFWRKTEKVVRTISHKIPENKKMFLCYLGFIFVSLVLGVTWQTGISIIVLIAFWVWAYYKIKRYGIEREKIRLALKHIYEGKTDIKLNENELNGVLKEMAIYINDIAGGFSNAISENLKSERLKTELITNVSHDIKTPLTSIINYVDLLKTENIENEKAKEYIKILDQKSQRLKKLIEDLVEASKASSGNVKLNLENINVKELFNQTIGEFEDKLDSKKLIIETDMPKEDIIVRADSRYLYRVVENLFSNISKYALDGSRIYIDIKEKIDIIEISIKNISKDKLNISSDELMQRFVRGDKSRYTEGSGLGLSIAQSLTELQGGKFNISIDGDLFKVMMVWPKVKKFQ